MKYEILQQAAEYCTKSKEWRQAFDLAFHAQLETINEQQAEIDALKAENKRLNKACDQRAAHEYKLMGDVGMLVAIKSELLAGVQAMLNEHQALTSSAFKLHGDIRELVAKARGDRA